MSLCFLGIVSRLRPKDKTLFDSKVPRDKDHLFKGKNMKTLDREDRWFVRRKKEAI